jgi:hypothetical protein
MKKTQTLIDETEALTRAVCVALDNNATAEQVATLRAARDAKLAEVRARPDGRSYDKGYR